MSWTWTCSNRRSPDEPAFRARQVWRWAANGAQGYEEMTDLRPRCATLIETVPFSTLELIREAHASDGTVKALFHTHDGRAVEAVPDALPRRPPLGLRLVAVRLPARRARSAPPAR